MTFPLRCEKSPQGGSSSPKQLKNGRIQRYLHYWRISWNKLGTKMTRRNQRNLILLFPGWPCGFRAARNKKHHKFGHFWHFLAVFERFLASSSSETKWSTWKPRKWYSVCSSWNFDTLFSPEPSSIVNWNKNQFCLPQCPGGQYYDLGRPIKLVWNHFRSCDHLLNCWLVKGVKCLIVDWYYSKLYQKSVSRMSIHGIWLKRKVFCQGCLSISFRKIDTN